LNLIPYKHTTNESAKHSNNGLKTLKKQVSGKNPPIE